VSIVVFLALLEGLYIYIHKEISKLAARLAPNSAASYELRSIQFDPNIARTALEHSIYGIIALQIFMKQYTEFKSRRK
jgi:hypothetical protein